MRVTEVLSLQPAEARLLRWLGLAVLLHAVLLLVPLGEPGPGVRTMEALSISLTTPVPDEPDRADPEPPETPIPEPRTQAAETPASAPSPEPAEIPIEPADPPQATPPKHRSAPSSELSAARLIELAKQREWSLPGTSTDRKLGVFVPRPPPDNWRSGKYWGASRFDGRSLPTDVEILDRWQAADGSHNVLVETPGGELLCGRAESWDPMRPLVENVMMFRTCGPGTRTFDWPDHYRASPAPPPEPARGR
jgi:hypothetical protein